MLTAKNETAAYLSPVYNTTEKLRKKFIDSRAINKLQRTLLINAVNHIRETLPSHILENYKLLDKKRAVVFIHFPNDSGSLQKARYRLKFEELFFVQLRLLKMKIARTEKFRGAVFNDSSLVTDFYNDFLPFDLTNAQKRVIKEVYRDLKSGQQMNRLVQGDVGSGKDYCCIYLWIAWLSVVMLRLH